MRPFVVKQTFRIKGTLFFPGDKSIAHRSIIISAISCGKTRIENFPANKDCLHTLEALKKFGIKINAQQSGQSKQNSLIVNVFGKGLYGLHKPKHPVFVGDSGTTLRLILGVLAGQNFQTKLIAGKSLIHRPMLRVNQPLRMMGAHINSKTQTFGSRREEYPPITIKGGNLKPIAYTKPVAPAQVNSAILLAGLYAKGRTCLKEPTATRDHTERMLKVF